MLAIRALFTYCVDLNFHNNSYLYISFMFEDSSRSIIYIRNYLKTLVTFLYINDDIPPRFTGLRQSLSRSYFTRESVVNELSSHDLFAVLGIVFGGRQSLKRQKRFGKVWWCSRSIRRSYKLYKKNKDNPSSDNESTRASSQQMFV